MCLPAVNRNQLIYLQTSDTHLPHLGLQTTGEGGGGRGKERRERDVREEEGREGLDWWEEGKEHFLEAGGKEVHVGAPCGPLMFLPLFFPALPCPTPFYLHGLTDETNIFHVFMHWNTQREMCVKAQWQQYTWPLGIIPILQNKNEAVVA